jgi:uncharacterized protein (TIGR00255 family)
MSRQPIRSMTGFARVRRAAPAGEIVLSLRSVNHRGLDLHFHMGAEMDPYEPALRKTIAGAVSRGHVDVRVSWKREAVQQAAAWNRPLMDAWMAAFRQASEAYDLQCEPDLNAALRVPGMLGALEAAEEGAEFEAEIVAACRDALSILNECRAREGAETADVIRQHAVHVVAAAASMERIRGSIVPTLQARLEERLADLLKNAATIEPQRLAQEAAILADRSDIGEEITRLNMHAGQLGALIDGGGEIGKKLDFLLQEMHRETNTILSKSNGTGEPGRRITDLALGVKSHIEKIREQSLNLE